MTSRARKNEESQEPEEETVGYDPDTDTTLRDVDADADAGDDAGDQDGEPESVPASRDQDAPYLLPHQQKALDDRLARERKAQD